MNIKKIITSIGVASLIFGSSSLNVFATETYGVWGVGDYPIYPQCWAPDLAQVHNLCTEVVETSEEINSNNTQYYMRDANVTKSDFITKAPNYHMSFFIGHGLYSSKLSLPKRLHISAGHSAVADVGPDDDPVYYENDPASNIYRSDLNFGTTVSYMHFHSCNFLRTDTMQDRVEILNMMDGVHQLLGYGTTMNGAIHSVLTGRKICKRCLG